jgi:hypothetical protein
MCLCVSSLCARWRAGEPAPWPIPDVGIPRVQLGKGPPYQRGAGAPLSAANPSREVGIRPQGLAKLLLPSGVSGLSQERADVGIGVTFSSACVRAGPP